MSHIARWGRDTIHRGSRRLHRAGLLCISCALASCASPWVEPQRGVQAEEPVPGHAREILRAIDALLAGHTDRDDEREILALLETATGPEFDYIVRHVDLHEMIEDMDRHAGGPDHRRALMDLVQRRLADLGAGARATIVTGCRSDVDENTLAQVILSARGTDLTDLKNAIDAGGGVLLDAVYDGIRDAGLRARVLDHIRMEAATCPTGELKILSSLDDTLYASIAERWYPPGTVYPGAVLFLRELDRAAGQKGARDGDIVFLTARPAALLGETGNLLRRLGLRDAIVVPGSVAGLVSEGGIADEKCAAFERYLALYPEYRFVLVGDDGEVDPEVARRLLLAHPDQIPAAFIHDVVGTTEGGGRERERAAGVLRFDTYVGAAVDAAHQGLLSPAAVARVADAALTELRAVPFDRAFPAHACEDELKRDLERARAAGLWPAS